MALVSRLEKSVRSDSLTSAFASAGRAGWRRSRAPHGAPASGERRASAFVCLGAVLAVLAVSVAVRGWSTSLLYNVLCWVTVVICVSVVLNPWQQDCLEAVKFACAIYGMSFGILPLLLAPRPNIEFFGPEWNSYYEKAAGTSVVSLLVLLSGYIVVRLFGRASAALADRASKSPLTLGFGLVFYALGWISYFVLVQEAGGLGHFLSYSGGRGDIFASAFGGWYWGVFFMISGISLIGAALAPTRPWLVVGVGLLGTVAWSVFQGREQALAPLFCSVVLVHYRRVRLSWRGLATVAVVLFCFAAFLGVWRGTAKRGAALSETLSTDVEQLDALAVSLAALDKGVEPMGGRTLLSWLSPIDRHLLPVAESLVDAGVFLNGLVRPEQKYSKVGMLPTLPGELYLNFGLVGVTLGMLVYGAVIGTLYGFVASGAGRASVAALYPYALWIVGRMSLDGVHLLFKLMVVALPILLTCLCDLVFSRKAVTAQTARGRRYPR